MTVTERDGTVGKWLRLDHFGPALWRDVWFVAAACVSAAVALACVLTSSWLGVLGSLLVIFWVGVLRHVVLRLVARRQRSRPEQFQP